MPYYWHPCDIGTRTSATPVLIQLRLSVWDRHIQYTTEQSTDGVIQNRLNFTEQASLKLKGLRVEDISSTDALEVVNFRFPHWWNVHENGISVSVLDTSSRISTILWCGGSNIPVQLMSQLPSSPGHQQSWYWLRKLSGYLWSTKKDFNYPTYILASPQKGPFTEYISFPFHFVRTTVNSLTCLRYKCYPCCKPQASRQHSGYGLSQWETMLQCNVVSHWLSP